MSPRHLVSSSSSSPGKVILHGEHSVVYGKSAVAASIGLRTKATAAVEESSASPSLTAFLPDLGASYHLGPSELKTLHSKRANIRKPSQLQVDLVADIASAIRRDNPEWNEDQVFYSLLMCAINRHSFFQAFVALVYLYLESFAGSSPMPSHVSIKVTSKLPVGAGLGSSAAFSVAISGSLRRLSLLWSDKINLSNNNKATKAKKRRKGIGNDCSNGINSDNLFSGNELDIVCARAYLAEKILHGNPSGEQKVHTHTTEQEMAGKS